MNSFPTYIGLVGIFVACVLLGGSFWSGFYVARRCVEHPLALIFLTLLFGSLIAAVTASGLVAGCFALAGTPMFR